MKRLIINIVLFLVAAVLIYLLAASIQGPIAFKQKHQERRNAVIEKLKNHRTAQKAYKALKEEYAPTMDTLKYVLLNDSFKITKIEGDADAKGAKVKKTFTYVQAKDSVSNLFGLESSDKLEAFLDDLQYVPFSNKKEFDMKADTHTYKNVLVPVIEVGTKVSTFMAEYTDPKFRRFDPKLDTAEVIKYGDLYRPSVSGSWD